jgi:hypothetical protein
LQISPTLVHKNRARQLVIVNDDALNGRNETIEQYVFRAPKNSFPRKQADLENKL